jgi:hypothetical protein
MASGFSNALPSHWGIKLIDAIAILILVALIVRFVAPTSGLAQAIHTFCSWLAAGVQWISTYLSRFLTWL